MNADHNGEDIKKENDGTTDVNGNEGPDAKKKKLGYVENSHKNEMVSEDRFDIFKNIAYKDFPLGPLYIRTCFRLKFKTLES